jgi:hypothetical protein
MADDLKYGYKGAEPTQSFGNNTGVFDPADINNLIADNKWTSFGQLELIETQTVSGTPTSVSFTNIQENIYNVHFLTYSNLDAPAQAQNFGFRFSTNGGSGYQTGNYQYAYPYVSTVGGTFDTKSTSGSQIEYGQTGSDTRNMNGYAYFYNLGDGTKYSFVTFQEFQGGAGNDLVTFGSGVYTVANVVNALQIRTTGGSGYTSGSLSLYGIKEYS